MACSLLYVWGKKAGSSFECQDKIDNMKGGAET